MSESAWPHTPPRRISAREWALLALVILIALILRTTYLASDAPMELSDGFLTDEGTWFQNARLRVLYGTWRVDDYNPGLFVAPTYSVALAGIFALFGIGLVQAHLLNALAGVVTCFLVFLTARLALPPRGAVIAALAQAVSYFAVFHDRAGFIEPFQLMLMMATLVMALYAVRMPWIGALGGLVAVATLFTKPSSGIIGVVVLGAWIIAFSGGSDRGGTGGRWLGPVWFSGVAAVVGTIAVVVWVLPHWDIIRLELADASHGVFSSNSPRAARTPRILFLLQSWFGLHVGQWFLSSGVALAAVVLLACRRLAGQEWREARVVEGLGWIWLAGGLLFMAFQYYQPDRRFYFLTPAISLLVGVEACRPSITLSRRRARDLGAGALAVIGALGGAFLGAVASGPLQPILRELARNLGKDLSWAGALSLGWMGVTAGGVVLAVLSVHWLPRGEVRWRPLWLVIAALSLGGGRAAWNLVHPTYTLHTAMREVGTLADFWPESERFIFGGAAGTLSLESRLVGVSGQLRGPGTWERFSPVLTVRFYRAYRPPTERFEREDGLPSELCRSFEIGPVQQDGRPRFIVEAYIRRDRRPLCPPARKEKPASVDRTEP